MASDQAEYCGDCPKLSTCKKHSCVYANPSTNNHKNKKGKQQ